MKLCIVQYKTASVGLRLPNTVAFSSYICICIVCVVDCSRCLVCSHYSVCGPIKRDVMLHVNSLLPLPLLQVDAGYWAGWLVYSLVILATFLTLKIINYRLHRDLGADPVPEEEEEEEKEEGEGEGAEKEKEDSKNGEHSKKEKETEEEEAMERKELGMDGEILTDEMAKAIEAGILHPEGALSCKEFVSSYESQTESLQRHRDSASTLGHSSLQHSCEDTTELQHITSTETEALVAVEVESEGGKENEEEEEEEGEKGEKGEKGGKDADNQKSGPITTPGAEEKGMGREAREEEEEDKGEESEEYHTPSVSLVPGAGMESGLAPIDEESVLSPRESNK